MSWWKQVALAAVLIVIGAVAWARLSPDAATYLARAGLPASLVATLAGAKDDAGPGQGRDQGRRQGFAPGSPGREVLVVTAPVGTARINDRVTAIGDGEAQRSVTVVPLSAGVITKVHFKAGDQVKKATVIAELDSESERIERDRTELAVEMAKEKFGRYEQLVSSRTVSTVQLNEARNEMDNARLALREAELKLSRRQIVAPIDGIVGIVPIEIGDYATTQTEIATLDDRSKLHVDFWVPERFAGTVKVGQAVEAIAIAMPGEQFAGTVSAVGSRIDRASRTLQVRAEIDNSADLLRPGMSFKVTMHFPGETFPAVHPLAIQWSSDGAYVWKEADGVAVKTPVRIVQRNSDSVLVDGELVAGEETVIEGVQTLRDGARLRIAGEAETQRPKGS